MANFLTVEDSLQVLPDGSALRAAGSFNFSIKCHIGVCGLVRSVLRNLAYIEKVMQDKGDSLWSRCIQNKWNRSIKNK